MDYKAWGKRELIERIEELTRMLEEASELLENDYRFETESFINRAEKFIVY